MSDGAKPALVPVDEALDVVKVMQLLPHRYPMLMIDGLRDIVPGISATGVKNVTMNEPFFQGHFPSRPVMPGVLIVEAMAQTSGALIMYSSGDLADSKLVYFMTIDKCRFRKPVVPGDTLLLHVSLIHKRGPVSKFHGEARVNGQLMAEADYSAMIADK
ncbi:MAG: 3-hydroxyacyl-[acyl-carrier-protein] dehydratase [Alphaproteobacteria bacterium]|nr:3-hydroxyacyl-[acyl-carrier-protein] dehydratase [Alphaproteobacteria bacterium]